MKTARFLPLAILLLAVGANAQIRIGTIKGAIADPAGAVVTDARVWLTNSLTGAQVETVTNNSGGFVFNNVPFNSYILRVEARGFAPHARPVTVSSNLPLELSISLSVAGTSEQISVTSREKLVEAESSSSATTLTEHSIRRAPRLNRNRQLQELIITTPGWAAEHDGLSSVRGVEGGVLYVLDGIPVRSEERRVGKGCDCRCWAGM